MGLGAATNACYGGLMLHLVNQGIARALPGASGTGEAAGAHACCKISDKSWNTSA